MSAAKIKATRADSQMWVGSRFWDNFLDLVAIELGIVISEFGGEEMSEKWVSQFVRVECETATNLFVALLVGGDIERWDVSVVEVIEVGVEVGHVVEDHTGKLGAGSHHSLLSIVNNAEIRSCDCCVFVGFFDKCHFNVWRKITEFSLNFIGQFLYYLFEYLFGRDSDKDFEVVSADAFDLVFFEELSEAIFESLEAEIDFIDIVASFQVDDILILTNFASCSELWPWFLDKFADPA